MDKSVIFVWVHRWLSTKTYHQETTAELVDWLVIQVHVEPKASYKHKRQANNTNIHNNHKLQAYNTTVHYKHKLQVYMIQHTPRQAARAQVVSLPKTESDVPRWPRCATLQCMDVTDSQF